MRWWRRCRRMRWALLTIGTTCTRYRGGSTCRAVPHLTPDARYGYDRWCDGCIAREGLEG